uniref:Phospholipase-like protein n=1 Tax=Tanacetum cinerariifolium TaxID=118510 RepID=A0A6L2NE44_TANCI|nr:phospholipase-like protein [Tanacetum cinerariifolium]
MLSRISFHVLIRQGSRCVFPTFPIVFRPFKTLCFFNYALMIRQDYDITSSLRRGALHCPSTTAAAIDVDQTQRKVATYEITMIEDDESEDDEYENDKYGLVKGPWSTSTRNAAKMLILVPPPCDDVLAVGDKSITSPSKEEFCLVTGLKFGVENWTDYNDEKEPILFRRKDRRPVPNWILRLANDRDGWDNYLWGSHVWPTLYQQLKDANVRRWPALYATQPEDEVDKKSYSITGFAWVFNTWILKSFRAATNDYYTRYRRLLRIDNYLFRDWYQMRLRLDRDEMYREFEKQKRGYKQMIENSDDMYGKMSRFMEDMSVGQMRLRLDRDEMYREFEKQKRGYKQMIENSDDMYGKMSRFMEDMSVGSVPLAKEPIIANQHYGISDLSGFQSYQILIRERAENDNWTLSKSGTICLHHEYNRFMILKDPYIIRILDGSMLPYPSWKDVNRVYMPINAGGVHWVTGAINLADSIFYMRGYFNGTGRQPYNFQFPYNDCFGYAVPQQQNAKDCGVITCWLIAKLCLGQPPTVVGDSQVYWDNIRNQMYEMFYKCKCEDTENSGYD